MMFADQIQRPLARLGLRLKSAFSLLLLAVLPAGPLLASDFVGITASAPVAIENSTNSGVNGQLVFSASTADPTNALPIQYSLVISNAMAALAPASYSLASSNAADALTTPAFVSGTTTYSGTITIPAGSTSVTLNVQARENSWILDEDNRILQFTISPGAYSILPNSSATIQLSEGDLKGTVFVPKPLATRQSIPGTSIDPDSNRRGIITFLLQDGTSPAPGNNRGWTAFINAELTGSAAVGADYTISYRVGPDGPGAATASNGLGYDVTAFLAGEGRGTVNSPALFISVPPTGSTAPVPSSGDVLSFGDAPSSLYTVQSYNVANGRLVLTSALNENHTFGTPVSFSNNLIAGYSVLFAYQAFTPSTTLKLENGSGGFQVGDCIQLANDTAFYVITALPAVPAPYPRNGEGTISPYTVSPQGLDVLIDTQVAVSPIFAVTFTNGVSNDIFVPSQSNDVSFLIDPTGPDSPGSGAEDVELDVVQTPEYELDNPSSGQVSIADDSNTLDITAVQDGTLPNGTSAATNGIMAVNLTGPGYARDINVPFVVSGPTVYGVDYSIANTTITAPGATTATGFVTIPAGQTSGFIFIAPGPGTLTSGTNVTVTLSASFDYLLASSANLTTNPTATVNLLPNYGLISASSTGTNLAEVTSPANYNAAADNGVITLTLTSATPAVSTVSVNLDFTVNSGTSVAVPGINYSLTCATAGFAFNAQTLSGTVPVTLAAGATTGQVVIQVIPSDSAVASNNLSLTLTAVSGRNYNIDPVNNQAVVTIVTNSPDLSVVKTADATAAGSSGQFSVSAASFTIGGTTYSTFSTGSGSMPVSYTLSGTAVLGVDYTITPTSPFVMTSPTMTIAVNPLGNTSGTFPKTVVLTLSPDSSASPRYLVGNSASATVSIPAQAALTTGTSTTGTTGTTGTTTSGTGTSATGATTGGSSTFSGTSSSHSCGLGGGMGLVMLLCAMPWLRRRQRQ